MPASPWQRCIQRAQELAGQHPYAAEILGFYIHVARFQEDLHRRMSAALQSPSASADRELTGAELAELTSRFQSFLSMAEAHGPKPLAELSRELRALGPNGWSDLLQRGWIAHSGRREGITIVKSDPSRRIALEAIVSSKRWGNHIGLKTCSLIANLTKSEFVFSPNSSMILYL